MIGPQRAGAVIRLGDAEESHDDGTYLVPILKGYRRRGMTEI
jgi:hypothetical protein